MLSSALVVIALLAVAQVLLVIKVADKLTETASVSPDSHAGTFQAGGRYAQPA